MTELRPCSECQRHVRVEDRECPFCDTPTEPAPKPRRLTIGRFTRAVVFSGALLAMAGCGDDDGESPRVDAGPPDAQLPLPYGAPPARARLV